MGKGFVHGRGRSLTVLMHISHVHSSRHHLPRKNVGAFWLSVVVCGSFRRGVAGEALRVAKPLASVSVYAGDLN